MLKFDKKVKALPRPCKPGMKGCPDPNGNPVKAPAVAAGSRKWFLKLKILINLYSIIEY